MLPYIRRPRPTQGGARKGRRGATTTTPTTPTTAATATTTTITTTTAAAATATTTTTTTTWFCAVFPCPRTAFWSGTSSSEIFVFYGFQKLP